MYVSVPLHLCCLAIEPGRTRNPINAGDLTVRLWVGYQRFEKTLGSIPGIVQRPVQIIQSIPVSI